jgi:hypothetical protein
MNLLGKHLGHVNHYFHSHWIQARKFKIRIQTSEKTIKKIGRYFRVFLG